MSRNSSMQSLISSGQQSIEDGQYKYFVADPENQAQNTNYGDDHGLRLILDQQKHAYHGTKLDNDVRPNRGDIESNNEATPLIKSRSMKRSTSAPSLHEGKMMHFDQEQGQQRSIRFQVVVWYVGPVDVVLNRVTMQFRVTMFWNEFGLTDHDDDSSKSETVWKMMGRRKACEKEILGDDMTQQIDVPPVSILNAVSFDVVGEPEVTRLREETKLMRWTCLYKAILVQDRLRVENFPHDAHELVLKLGVLTQRKPSSRWDKSKWRLDLATREDSQGSTRIPHGLIVDQVKIPEFSRTPKELSFEFVPLSLGAEDTEKAHKDKCLQIKLDVIRESGYYDQNIMPLLGMLNLIAVSMLSIEATDFFKRGLLMLNICFVEISIRMSADSKLPRVGYQIKIQRILNSFFFAILSLVMESSALYFAITRYKLSIEIANKIDAVMAVLVLLHTLFIFISYYYDRFLLKQRLNKS
mmetsp:Transcript_37715/g.45559  ORF Transcript_37715/g.45559 Transcript_37715/m.45559 type:complete len:468 (+) Transcript_37715:116-1519(+)